MAAQHNATEINSNDLELTYPTDIQNYSIKNKYYIENDIIYVYIKNKIMKVNKKHKNIVLNSTWFLIDGYATATINYKKVRCHRLITNTPHDKVIDHIDHDKLNNLDENLRICTQKENRRNHKNQHGVSFYKRHNKWRARINVDNKDIHLGYFESYDEALQARKKAELEVWNNG